METPQKENTPGFSKYARYSSLVIQMGVVIGFFTWLGTFLDNKYETKTPWWTLGLSLFGVFSGLYLIIREVLNTNKEDEK